MKKIVKYGVILSTSVLLTTGCSLHKNQRKNETIKTTVQNSQNWEGTYFGTVPCASCPGIKTWVKLDSAGNVPKYSIVEEYLEEKDGIFITDGKIKTDDSNFLTLKENSGIRTIFVGQDFISFTGDDKKLNKLYSLQKMDEFKQDKKTLYVNPKSIKVDEPFIVFEGVVNSQESRKSLQAVFEFDCENEKYKVKKGKWYKESYALGEGQDIYGNNQLLNTFVGDNIFTQVAKKYCIEKEL